MEAHHGDAAHLVTIGLADKDDNGALHFPYAGMHLELDRRTAA